MGRLICVGLGPGDPELMSVKAHRLVAAARHVAFFRKKGRAGQARRIVEGILAPEVTEYPMEYPVTTEIAFSDPAYNGQLAAFYETWATRLTELCAGHDVVVLCEGDPFFYGSFMHLYARLKDQIEIEIVPGITGMSGCWTATGAPVTWGDDVLTVLMATLPEADLAQRAAQTDALVVMKIGRNLPKLVRALRMAGKYDAAWLVSHGTMAEERIMRLADVSGEVPYFSVVVVHGQGRRP